MLLHLTLMGDHNYAGNTIKGNDSSGEGATKSILRPLGQPLKIVQRSNSGINLEALVAAAVVLASHRGGYYGVNFPLFLGRLLYELGMGPGIDSAVDLPMSQKTNNYMVPYLSMPNTEWPKWFLKDWRKTPAFFAIFSRTPDAERIELKVYDDSSECKEHELYLSGECKDRANLEWRTSKIF
ncbi:unnamed protein product [Phytophthora lilii]|uniref:Unnamed protein product n=1 Tax=Phytophthora lilii TaxID=2077276 RepID=A0A9W7CMC5_9STRA|nr:unnamed protein product [Phytophthora lilii]